MKAKPRDANDVLREAFGKAQRSPDTPADRLREARGKPQQADTDTYSVESLRTEIFPALKQSGRTEETGGPCLATGGDADRMLL